ncbi:MAG: metal-transporting ATPase [Pseudomonas sp.]|uniref:heavy metal translocating P-type ATPase n=1 Tax=Pseudomonas sp. TaxID=306 RepID=UPI0012128F82|nr:heavy metal translocating P-type ATPase [Pseudomonas sp.]RZI73930.1 MAG: metal-transporting ATPase [Pseudomonas sp.]
MAKLPDDDRQSCCAGTSTCSTAPTRQAPVTDLDTQAVGPAVEPKASSCCAATPAKAVVGTGCAASSAKQAVDTCGAPSPAAKAESACCAPKASAKAEDTCCASAVTDTMGDSCCAPPSFSAAKDAQPEVVAPNTFRISTMDCAVEESEIRRAVEPIDGIRGLHFRLAQRNLRIDGTDAAVEAALVAIRKAGFAPEPVAARAATAAGATDDHGHDHAEGPSYVRLAAALGLAIVAEGMAYFAPDTMVWKGLGMAVAAVAIWLAGIETYTKGLIALRRGKLNINALMSVAVTGAFLIGQWPEAAMVMALYAIAELIEARAVDRARNAIKGLVDLAPDEADIQQADGRWQRMKATDIALNAIARVKPGERVALDGRVTKGNSSIDQSPVTGESIPVDKEPGDLVFAGTINQNGELEFQVTAAASNSTLARIIHAVEEAQGTRAPTQRFVDRFAAIYTPAVFALALAVAVLPPLLLDWAWMTAIYKALVLLVIACPCALVISTPVTVVSGLAAAARRGILIKGGTYLEEARHLKAIALDKTGTLTEGKPKLVAFTPSSPSSEAQTKRWAKSLASRSDHPVSQSIMAGLDGAVADVDAFQALLGRGVEGVIEGKRMVLGNHRLIKERKQSDARLEAELAGHEAQGRTVTLLADEDSVLGIFAVADTIKASSIDAVKRLQKLGVVPVMLTGDNVATAQAVGREAGIAEVRGGLLPEDKLAAIKELRERHGATAMTGDGINDAPALAQADIGFAMGGAGTDTAMEAADVVIMNDDLGRIAETIRLSRRTHSVLMQNITLALGIKAVFFVLAVFGSATMWMAVFADMGASLLVVGNGLRLLRKHED